MSSSAVLINDARACASLLVRNSKLFINPQYWHKITIHNCEGIHRDVLLKAVLDAIHPNDLIPVHFRKEDSNASFLARNCKAAIEKLCQNNLFIANPLNNNLPFKLSIVLAYSTTNDLQINVQDNVLEVLNKRYNSTTKTLNLDAFYKDPDLEEFCVLSQPKILYFVLHLSKNLIVQHLKLSNNDISILNPVESLWGVKNLTSLDLRNNSIESIKKLTILSSLSIHDLWLDGNPLCDEYDEYTYVQAVKEVCPQIEKLDGIILRQSGFPAFRRNYLCNPKCQEMIDNFMEHYFTIYDNKNERNKLLGIYEQNATFSITSRYLIGQSTSATASLTPYKLVSRNIRTLSDLAKSDENLVMGNEKIIKIIQNLPPTEHDPYTFTVDLMKCTDELILLVVNGVFRECSDNLSAPERILGFTRTFILGANDNNEYRIINEQLHVSNATTIQQQRAFKVVKVAKDNIFTSSFTEAEKKEMIEAVKTFTTMNMEWSKKCLEECHYNLPKALSLFVDLYKVDNIPEEAFQR
ncbi:nuclear RNA export factor 1 isoform X3 [Agrilus planipennis]|nr:nuclear RNA export factor 1 isoform X3 [Agrilus planipennis]